MVASFPCDKPWLFGFFGFVLLELKRPTNVFFFFLKCDLASFCTFRREMISLVFVCGPLSTFNWLSGWGMGYPICPLLMKGVAWHKILNCTAM